MATNLRTDRMRRLATRFLEDPLGVRRFRPDFQLDPEDLPGLDRNHRLTPCR